ncbi:ABC transporter permease [Aureimonas populi]|uniref:ABC transporter permease n=1 Tax=Aureimonas populi TaxID=1701758 RepID=A0ABW5CM36_9HYPH|nr:ABC transporter permease [Aureimonas populi]
MIRHFRSRPAVIASLAILACILLAAAFGPMIAPHDPLLINAQAINQGSSAAYLLGTDEFGRDILSRLLYGIRPTIVVATGATVLAAILGTALGIIGGYSTGWLGTLVMRGVDILLCFPPILFALLAVGFWQSGILSLTVVIGVVYAPQFARIAQSVTLQVARQDYIQAEQLMGARVPRIVFTGILPNILSVLMVQATLTMAEAILLESGLSFLGLGIVPPTPSWGQMIGTAQSYLSQNPMYLVWPAIFLAITVLAINIIGDSLRDHFDPRLRRD